MSVTQIALKAGVSIATVSRVLNNSRRVDPEIAARVRSAAAELNLPVRLSRRPPRPRAASQHLTIAIVSVGQSYHGWFQVPVIASVVAELSRAATDLQMGVLMTEMPDPRQVSSLLRRSEVSGAIAFVDSELHGHDLQALAAHLPVVRVMGDQVGPSEVDHVGCDNNAVGYLAGNYLLNRGIRDLAFWTTSAQWDLSRLRGQGFIAAAQHSGLTPRVYLLAPADAPVALFGPAPIVEQSVEALIDRLVANHRGPTGLFVSRDEEVVAVYRLARERGLEPGRDLVVISCDNDQIRLSMLHPRPASIDLGAAEIAQRAVQRLARRIKHRNESPVRLLTMPRLIEGAHFDSIPA